MSAVQRSAGPGLDPVTSEVIRHGLDTIVEEMRAAVRRTAYSVVIKDLLDFSCALFDPRGRLIASAADLPALLGTMGPALRAAMERWGEDVSAGDVIMSNHPYRGVGHTNDVTIMLPTFDDAGSLIGWAGVIAHHADWGGRVPGTASSSNRSVFEEGVLLPAVKLVERGVVNQGVWDIMTANVRHPAQNLGDLRSQLAAARSGERRLRLVAAEYGSEVLDATCEALIAHSAERTRTELARWPDASASAEGFLDDDGLEPGVPVRIFVTVTVTGEHVTIDWTGSGPQVGGGMNCPQASMLSCVHYGIRCFMPSDIPFNEGAMSCVSAIAPEGTVVNPRFPAAVGDRNHTTQRMADVLTRALAQLVPERGSAGWFAGAPATIIECDAVTSGEPSVLLSILGGGAGASSVADGASGLDTHVDNCALISAEVVEATYPLRVERYELRPDSGGAGRHRGGLGTRADFRILTDAPVPVRVETEQGAEGLGARGAEGGHDGAIAEAWLIRDGEDVRLPPKGLHHARPGDIVSVRAGGGGGSGDPADRPRDAVEADLRAERISARAARDLYGYRAEGA